MTAAGAVMVPRFVQPTVDDITIAERIVNSQPVISAYASCDWEELGDDGRVWIAAIVREASRIATAVPSDRITEINAFLSKMADRFRERTSRRVLGFRIHSHTREQAMMLALGTYDASLDMLGVPFGHPSYAWDTDMACELVDDELQHWEP